jgi:hypothetical protein
MKVAAAVKVAAAMKTATAVKPPCGIRARSEERGAEKRCDQ